MKIRNLEVMACRAGWRDWAFLKITSDDGIVGWADCTDSNGSPAGVVATLRMLAPGLIGRDPRPIELIWWDLYRQTRQSEGGVVRKALAAIENALLDLNAKSLGIPVARLLGGPVRNTIQLYWSHCATTRVRSFKHISKNQINDLADIAALANEVVAQGYTALKTNIIIPGSPATIVAQGFKGPEGSADRNITKQMLNGIENVMGTFRDAVGPDIEIMLDANMHFRGDGNLTLAKALAPFHLAWLELDTDTPEMLKTIKDTAEMPIASGERLLSPREYNKFLGLGAMDVCLIDPKWIGVATAKKIADMANMYEVNVAPHNHGSPLSALMSAHFCGAVSNLRIMEFDVDDIPWWDDVIDQPLEISNGQLLLPQRPGWGANVNEEAIHSHLVDI